MKNALSLPRQICGKMKRCRAKIAVSLLMVFLSMWLLAAFHVHSNPSSHGHVANEQPASDLDDDCLLCQFQQLVYEDAPQESVLVILPEAIVETIPMKSIALSAFDQKILSRAPPVLL